MNLNGIVAGESNVNFQGLRLWLAHAQLESRCSREHRDDAHFVLEAATFQEAQPTII